ncbi:MAG: helix-turn-helix transcriptional regulator [Bifidobacterium psychraerophilum]|uniref:helix-turn-helix transcriptional regulator n=1 Tax=Bifidobacterium psychraerophilum TaxID=218140 RepID=UPI0039E81F5F
MPSELGRFLSTRRARLNPQESDLPRGGHWRRVPGLRREEVAELAGISTSYYTRLERGSSSSASPSVLDALARALHLDDAERAHLYDLTQLTVTELHHPRRKNPGPSAARLLAAIGSAPAILMGRYTDILGWNTAGHRLIAPHLDEAAPSDARHRPVMARLLFLDPLVRDMYEDWQQAARINVGYLRLTSGRHPDDATLASLIGELSMHSPEFARLWAAHDVHECTLGDRTLLHPAFGALHLHYQVWTQPDDPDLRLQIYTAEADSTESRALSMLSSEKEIDASLPQPTPSSQPTD